MASKVGRDRLDSLFFVSSGFLRARQTAEECRSALQNIVEFEQEAIMSAESQESPETASSEEGDTRSWEDLGVRGIGGGYDVFPLVVIRKELRERSFGELDATILVNYNKVRS